MKVLVIDPGSYSVKFYEAKLERKLINLLDFHEVVINQVRDQLPPLDYKYGPQLQIVQQFLGEMHFEGKMISLIPQDLITSRYFELPVSQRKKADLMIPFQLDDDLPFSSQDAIYNGHFFKKNETTEIVLNVSKEKDFVPYYNQLEHFNIMPNLLSSQLAYLQSYLLTQNQDDRCVVYLDIGHHYTQAYFAINQRIYSNHTSHIAGHSIDEIISNTYGIDASEATVYKHENCFFLTENQYEDVDQDQKDFALLMKTLFHPLILDFKRWELGFRVKHNRSVEEIFIFGGTSNVNNIANFLSQNLGKKVSHFNPYENLSSKGLELQKKLHNTYGLCQVMTQAQKAKSMPPNFLVGKYSSGTNQSLPLHSNVFVFTRVSVLALLVIFSLFVEYFFYLKPQNESLDKEIKKLLKSPQLQLSRKEQRRYRNKPDSILKMFKKKNKSALQQLKGLSQSSQKDATKPLIRLSESLSSNKEIDLVRFKSESEQVELQFHAKKPEALLALKTYFNQSGEKNLKVQQAESEGTLSVSYEWE